VTVCGICNIDVEFSQFTTAVLFMLGRITRDAKSPVSGVIKVKKNKKYMQKYKDEYS